MSTSVVRYDGFAYRFVAYGMFRQSSSCRSQQKKKRKESLVLPEGVAEEEFVIDEGQEIIFKSPSSRSSAEEDSAIQDILDRGSDVDDDEIEEATKRLLACTLLPDEINDIWESNDTEFTGHHHDVERPHEHITENGNGDDDEGYEVQDDDDEASAESNGPVGYGSNYAAAPRQESNSDDAPPNEMTSLLGNEASGSGTSMSSHNEEMLRPSIFTTVSDIDTQRRMDLN